MKTATLLKVWTVLVLGWLLVLGPGVYDLYLAWRQTGDLRTGFLLLMAVRTVLVSLVVALVLHVFYRRGAHQRVQGVRGIPEIDASPLHTLPGMAQLVTALGLTFLLSQLPRPAYGGLVLGVLVTAAGAALLRRNTLRIEPGMKLVRTSHLFGRPLRTTELVLPHTGRIGIKAVYRKGAVVSVGDLTVVEGLDYEGALRLAQTLERALGRPVEDEIGRARRENQVPAGVRFFATLSRLTRIAGLILLVLLPVAWMIPAGRVALCRSAVPYLLLDDAPWNPFWEDACQEGPGEESPPGR